VGKPKKKNQQKRRRRDRKRLERRKAKKAALKLGRSLQLGRSRFKAPPGLAGFSEDDQLFWLAHGANYLASDYDEGIWNPVLESLYVGDIPTPASLTQAIISRFKKGEELDVQGKAVLAWTVQERPLVYLFAREIQRSVRKADPDCDAKATARMPKHPVVWEAFQAIKSKVLSSQD